MVNIQVAQVRPPLTQFQATRFEEKDVFKLLKAVNSSCENPIRDEVLDRSFRALWPQFNQEIAGLISNYTAVETENSPVDVDLNTVNVSLGDLIKTVQSLRSDIRSGVASSIATGAIRDFEKMVKIIDENFDADGDLVIVGSDAVFVGKKSKAILNHLRRRRPDVVAHGGGTVSDQSDDGSE